MDINNCYLYFQRNKIIKWSLLTTMPALNLKALTSLYNIPCKLYVAIQSAISSSWQLVLKSTIGRTTNN